VVTQEKDRRRHGQPEGADITPATVGDTSAEPNPALREALAKSDIVTQDEAGMAGGSSGGTGGTAATKGHPDATEPDTQSRDPDQAPELR
jgi:hypothetical protein